jgi:hypothetical protein
LRFFRSLFCRCPALALCILFRQLLLEARALSDIGRHGVALEVIANIKSYEVIRLRADILWTAKRWHQSAERNELLYGARCRQVAPLTDAEQTDIMRGAIGYALGEDAIGLARFRQKYAPRMAGTSDAHAFEVVTAPVGTRGNEFEHVAQTIAGIDKLEAFLRDLRKRYPDTSPAEDTGAKAKPDAAAKPVAEAPQTVLAEKDAPNAPANAKAPISPRPPQAPAEPDKSPTGSIRSAPTSRR